MTRFLKWNPTEKVMEEIEEAGAAGGNLGTPTDGNFTDGFFEFQPGTTTVTDAIDDINELLAAIAPSKPGNLGGTTLTLSGTTQYSAKLPSGLGVEWGAYTPGATISNLIVDNTYTLTSASTSDRFYGGLLSDAASGGTLVHYLNGSSGDSRDVSEGVGSTGVLEITNISAYNTIWRKVNARLNVAQATGLETHQIQHDVSGNSNITSLYYDDTHPAPSFSVAPSLLVSTALYRYLSGIQYLKEGSVIDVSFTAASGIFEKAYHPTAVATVAVPSATSVTANPASVPAVSDTFAETKQLTLLASNIENLSPLATVTLRKPDNQSHAETTPLPNGINTYASGASTTTADYFVDELRRLELGTDNAWDSSVALATGNLQVGGGLRHGIDGDYPGHGDIDAAWERKISATAKSNGVLTFGGVTASQVLSYGTGQLNVFILLETDNIWFDLGLDFGLNNGDGSGDSLANSKGARILASGSTLNYSFGTYNTGNNSNEYRLRVVYRGAHGLTMTSIVGP